MLGVLYQTKSLFGIQISFPETVRYHKHPKTWIYINIMKIKYTTLKAALFSLEVLRFMMTLLILPSLRIFKIPKNLRNMLPPPNTSSNGTVERMSMMNYKEKKYLVDMML